MKLPFAPARCRCIAISKSPGFAQDDPGFSFLARRQSGATIPLTVRGAGLLREELQRLKAIERPAVIQAIAEARALNVVGLMNVQFAIQEINGEHRVYVLEVNPRASRTVPYVSKATGLQLAKIAAR